MPEEQLPVAPPDIWASLSSQAHTRMERKVAESTVEVAVKGRRHGLSMPPHEAKRQHTKCKTGPRQVSSGIVATSERRALPQPRTPQPKKHRIVWVQPGQQPVRALGMQARCRVSISTG